VIHSHPTGKGGDFHVVTSGGVCHDNYVNFLNLCSFACWDCFCNCSPYQMITFRHFCLKIMALQYYIVFQGLW